MPSNQTKQIERTAPNEDGREARLEQARFVGKISHDIGFLLIARAVQLSRDDPSPGLNVMDSNCPALIFIHIKFHVLVSRPDSTTMIDLRINASDLISWQRLAMGLP